MSAVISNTAPLIALADINQLEMGDALYQQVLQDAGENA